MSEVEIQNTASSSIEIFDVESRINLAIKKRELVGKVREKLLKENIHYGVVPGTSSKPSLFKSGAELLASTFNLDPQYTIQTDQLPNGHINIVVVCTLYSIDNGKRLGSAMGSCSTLESKYRYRGGAYDILEEDIPHDYKEKKTEYRKQGFGAKNVNGSWIWVKYNGEKTENPDIADQYNTVLKMATKRALVAVTLTALAISDYFTQDIEDLQPGQEGEPGAEGQPPKKENKKPDQKPEGKKEDKPLNVEEDYKKLQGFLSTNVSIQKLETALTALEGKKEKYAEAKKEAEYEDGISQVKAKIEYQKAFDPNAYYVSTLDKSVAIRKSSDPVDTKIAQLKDLQIAIGKDLYLFQGVEAIEKQGDCLREIKNEIDHHVKLKENEELF